MPIRRAGRAEAWRGRVSRQASARGMQVRAWAGLGPGAGRAVGDSRAWSAGGPAGAIAIHATGAWAAESSGRGCHGCLRGRFGGDGRGAGCAVELSERERKIVAGVVASRANEDIAIAAALGVSAKSVEAYLPRLYGRFSVGLRMELEMRAEQEGWLDGGGRPADDGG